MNVLLNIRNAERSDNAKQMRMCIYHGNCAKNTMNEKVSQLEHRLDSLLPEPGEDGIYGDGSHEYYAALFESAYDRAEAIAREAIAIIKEQSA